MRILLFGLFLASASVFAESFSSTFDVYADGLLVGEMKTHYQESGSRYTYRKKSRSVGLAALFKSISIDEYSEGLVSPVFESKKYSYMMNEDGKTQKAQASIINRQVSGQYKGKAFQYASSKGVIDLGVLDVVIAKTVARINRNTFQIKLIESEGLGKYDLSIKKNQNVSVPLGSFEAVEVSVNYQNKNKQTKVWIAPSLGYLPIQVFHQEGSDPAIVSKLSKTSRYQADTFDEDSY